MEITLKNGQVKQVEDFKLTDAEGNEPSDYAKADWRKFHFLHPVRENSNGVPESDGSGIKISEIKGIS